MRLPLAVLIDAENISHGLFVPLLEKVEALGNPIVWQLHGELTAGWKPMWLEIASEHGLEVRHQFHNGRNAADIAMTVAAMDLMHGEIIKGFCIASGDADFTPLVRRLKAQNLPVYGFGRPNAAAALRKACTEFFDLVEPLALKHGESDDPRAEQADIARLRDLLHSICKHHGKNDLIAPNVAGQYLRAQARDLAERVLGKSDLTKKLVDKGIAVTQTVDGQKLLRVSFPRPAVVKR